MFIYKKVVLLGIILHVLMFISGCSQIWNASIGGETLEELQQRDYEDLIQYEITDIDRNIKCKDYVLVNISQPMMDYENAEDCTLESENIIIYRGGNYVVYGKTDECRLIVNTYDDEIVHLFLTDVEWKTEGGPVIYVEQAGKVIITLVAGTENIIFDDAGHSSDIQACIFSNSDLTINGNGKLSVYGYYHDAVRSKNRVKVIDANLYIKSQNDGIRGNDGVIFENSTIQIESKGIGIKTKSEKGYVVISGGICKIIAGENAIRADNYVGIYGCDYTFSSIYEAVQCNGKKELERSVK